MGDCIRCGRWRAGPMCTTCRRISRQTERAWATALLVLLAIVAVTVAAGWVILYMAKDR